MPRVPRRAGGACLQAGQSHLPGGDGADCGVRRPSYAQRPDRPLLRSSRGRGYLHHRAADREPHRLQLADGRVTFSPPGVALYPADVVVADPTATLDLRSTRAQDKLRLGYFTGGASWQASYQVVLGGSEARVTGTAVLESQALRAEDAEVQLLAGAVSRAAPPNAPPVPYLKAGARAAMAMEESAVSEQRVGEF